MHFVTACFFLPMISTSVVVQIHRFSIFNPGSSYAFVRNSTWPTVVSIDSCIWECVYETRCQTAIYLTNEKICSIVAESCKLENIYSLNNIPSLTNIQASVICYRNEPGECIYHDYVKQYFFLLKSLVTYPFTAVSQLQATAMSLDAEITGQSMNNIVFIIIQI